MPRVNELKYQYLSKDIGATLVGLMYRNKVTQIALADALSITQGGFNYKLRNNAFTYRDLLIIFKELDLSDEEILRLMKA